MQSLQWLCATIQAYLYSTVDSRAHTRGALAKLRIFIQLFFSLSVVFSNEHKLSLANAESPLVDGAILGTFQIPIPNLHGISRGHLTRSINVGENKHV